MLPRCSRDAAEMQPRCSRDAAEMRAEVGMATMSVSFPSLSSCPTCGRHVPRRAEMCRDVGGGRCPCGAPLSPARRQRRRWSQCRGQPPCQTSRSRPPPCTPPAPHAGDTQAGQRDLCTRLNAAEDVSAARVTARSVAGLSAAADALRPRCRGLAPASSARPASP